MANIKVNYTVGVDADFTEKTAVSPKERVNEIFNRINNSLSSPYYASKVLKEYQDEILQIVESLEKETLAQEILGRDVTQCELLDKVEKMTEEKSPESKNVWMVLQCTMQNNYSEGRYFTTAEDATEVLAVYDNEDAAQDIAVKLEREEAERQGRDDYDIECDGCFYYKVLPMEVHHEPRWSELQINMDHDNVRDDR